MDLSEDSNEEEEEVTWLRRLQLLLGNQPPNLQLHGNQSLNHQWLAVS